MNREKLEKWAVALYMLVNRDRFPKKDWAVEKRRYAMSVTRWNEATLVDIIDFALKCLESR